MALNDLTEPDYQALTAKERIDLEHAINASCFLDAAEKMKLPDSGRFEYLTEKRELLLDYFPHQFGRGGRDDLAAVPDSKVGVKFSGVYSHYAQRQSEYRKTIFRLVKKMREAESDS